MPLCCNDFIILVIATNLLLLLLLRYFILNYNIMLQMIGSFIPPYNLQCPSPLALMELKLSMEETFKKKSISYYVLVGYVPKMKGTDQNWLDENNTRRKVFHEKHDITYRPLLWSKS